MSSSKQLHYSRSLSVSRAARLPSPHLWPVTLSRSPWRVSVKAVSKAGSSCSDILFALLCWITAEFLAGCAGYAQAMYLIPIDIAADVVDLIEPERPVATVTDLAPHLAPPLQMDRASESAFP